MQEEALKNGEVFFSDLSLRLKAEDNNHLPEGGGHLPVCFGGNEIRAVLPNGGLTIKKRALPKTRRPEPCSVVSETLPQRSASMRRSCRLRRRS